MFEERRPSYRENVSSLAAAQKSGAGVPAYLRWVNRALGRRIAAAAAVLRATPNQVTGMSAALSLAGLLLVVLVEPSPLSGIGAAVLLALGFAFDSADGQLARLTGTGGPAGEWLDHVVDAIRTPLVHIAVAVAVLRFELGGKWHGVLLGIALAFAVVASAQFMSQILAEQLGRSRGARNTEASGIKKSLALIPMDTGTLCWAFALWGLSAAFVPVYIALFAINLLYALVSMQRKYRRLKAL